MTGAARGIYLERRVAEDLATRGWFTIRAAGSHGVADVVAIRPGETVFIQCKTDGQIRGTEWNRLYEICHGLGTVPLVAQWETKTHRKIMYVQITGPHKAHSRDWDFCRWAPITAAAIPAMAKETAAKVQALELERLNRVPRRW